MMRNGRERWAAAIRQDLGTLGAAFASLVALVGGLAIAVGLGGMLASRPIGGQLSRTPMEAVGPFLPDLGEASATPSVPDVPQPASRPTTEPTSRDPIEAPRERPEDPESPPEPTEPTPPSDTGFDVGAFIEDATSGAPGGVGGLLEPVRTDPAGPPSRSGEGDAKGLGVSLRLGLGQG